MAQLHPHGAKESAPMLTCFNSDPDDKMGLGIPHSPGIICAPNDIWYAHTPQHTMTAANA